MYANRQSTEQWIHTKRPTSQLQSLGCTTVDSVTGGAVCIRLLVQQLTKRNFTTELK